MPELHDPSFEGKHALLHTLVQTGVDGTLDQVGDDCGYPGRVRQTRCACKRRIAHRIGGHIAVQRQRFGH